MRSTQGPRTAGASLPEKLARRHHAGRIYDVWYFMLILVERICVWPQCQQVPPRPFPDQAHTLHSVLRFEGRELQAGQTDCASRCTVSQALANDTRSHPGRSLILASVWVSAAVACLSAAIPGILPNQLMTSGLLPQ